MVMLNLSCGNLPVSDDKIAKVDRDGNGHHETFFKIIDDKLIYFGSTGKNNRWIDAGKGFEYILESPDNFDLIYK